MRKLIREGAQIPKGWGIAYVDFNKLYAVAYPIPFNLVVHVLRKLWVKIVNPCATTKVKKNRKVKKSEKN